MYLYWVLAGQPDSLPHIQVPGLGRGKVVRRHHKVAVSELKIYWWCMSSRSPQRQTDLVTSPSAENIDNKSAQSNLGRGPRRCESKSPLVTMVRPKFADKSTPSHEPIELPGKQVSYLGHRWVIWDTGVIPGTHVSYLRHRWVTWDTGELPETRMSYLRHRWVTCWYCTQME